VHTTKSVTDYLVNGPGLITTARSAAVADCKVMQGMYESAWITSLESLTGKIVNKVVQELNQRINEFKKSVAASMLSETDKAKRKTELQQRLDQFRAAYATLQQQVAPPPIPGATDAAQPVQALANGTVANAGKAVPSDATANVGTPIGTTANGGAQ